MLASPLQLGRIQIEFVGERVSVRTLIFLFLGLSGISTFAAVSAEDTADCYRRVDPRAQISRLEKFIILPAAQRLYRQLWGKWGNFIEFRQALYYQGQLHVVAQFRGEPKPIEIVVIYDPKEGKVVSMIAADPASGKLQQFNFE